jgi:hypothetical protein
MAGYKWLQNEIGQLKAGTKQSSTVVKEMMPIMFFNNGVLTVNKYTQHILRNRFYRQFH